MNEYKFYLLTDPHFFKNSLGAYGEGYENLMKTEQKCFAETESMNRATVKWLKENAETENILIAGDLSFNGEKESHIEYSKLLKELKETGKNIYVITASHDIEPHPFCFPGSKEKTPTEGIEFDDILDYYHEFGYDNAIAFNREHMSYVAQLNENIRLLALCNDTKDKSKSAYDEEFLKWIKAQLDKAKEDGQMIFAMEHYPLIAGQPVLSFFPDARQPECEKVIELLADNGCHLCFTGHMHNQSINVTTTKKGNKFYDVCTGSLIGCPAFMRLCTIKDDSTVEIKSIPVPDFEWDKKGKTHEKYLQDQFDSMIINLLRGMRDTPAVTMKKINMSENKFVEKLLHKVGKFFCDNDLGHFAKLFFVKAEPEAENINLLEFFTNVIRYTFCGNQPYTEDSPEGKTFLKILKRLNPVLKIAGKKIHDSQGGEVDLYEMLKHTLGNYGIDDDNAVIKLK